MKAKEAAKCVEGAIDLEIVVLKIVWSSLHQSKCEKKAKWPLNQRRWHPTCKALFHAGATKGKDPKHHEQLPKFTLEKVDIAQAVFFIDQARGTKTIIILASTKNVFTLSHNEVKVIIKIRSLIYKHRQSWSSKPLSSYPSSSWVSFALQQLRCSPRRLVVLMMELGIQVQVFGIEDRVTVTIIKRKTNGSPTTRLQHLLYKTKREESPVRRRNWNGIANNSFTALGEANICYNNNKPWSVLWIWIARQLQHQPKQKTTRVHLISAKTTTTTTTWRNEKVGKNSQSEANVRMRIWAKSLIAIWLRF